MKKTGPKSWEGPGKGGSTRTGAPRTTPDGPTHPGSAELLLKSAAPAAAVSPRVCGKFLGQDRLQRFSGFPGPALAPAAGSGPQPRTSGPECARLLCGAGSTGGTQGWTPRTLIRRLWNVRPPGTAPGKPGPPASATRLSSAPSSPWAEGEKEARKRDDNEESPVSPRSLVTHPPGGPEQSLRPSRGLRFPYCKPRGLA